MNDIVRKAFQLATSSHEGQTYGDMPYITHPGRVVQLLTQMGHTDPETLAVGWLHDVVEDTSVTLDDILLEFGGTIADAVDAITRRRWNMGAATFAPIPGDKPAPDYVMKESESLYLARVCENPIARLVKWADMCDNLVMTHSASASPEKAKLWKKYLKALWVLAEKNT